MSFSLTINPANYIGSTYPDTSTRKKSESPVLMTNDPCMTHDHNPSRKQRVIDGGVWSSIHPEK